MAQEIPLTSDPSQRLEIELNGIRYFFTVSFNWNGGKWYFTLENSTGTIIKGVSMLLGQDMLDAHEDIELGQLWMIDLSGKNEDALFDDLGSRVIMVHYPIGESPSGVDNG